MPGIVIIEDDSLMCALLREWLTAAGYTVREDGPRHRVTSGYNADLVIVDLYMPRQSGPAIVRAAQRAHPGTPVIAISGQFRPGLADSAYAARALGARKVIAKPFGRDELLAAVRAVIGAPVG